MNPPATAPGVTPVRSSTASAITPGSSAGSEQFKADTINIGPGQRYDVIWEALEPGKWLIHCHINHHTTNNNVETDGAGGLTMIINVTE